MSVLTFKAIVDKDTGNEQVVEQNVAIPAEVTQSPNPEFALQIFAQTALVQLGVGGVIKTEGKKRTLIAAHRLWEISVEPPTILLPSDAEVAAVKKPGPPRLIP